MQNKKKYLNCIHFYNLSNNNLCNNSWLTKKKTKKK